MKIRFFAMMALALVAFSSFSHAAKPFILAAPQQVTSFDFLRTHRQGSGVALSWSAATDGVDHFLIERSYDGGEFFEPVDELPATRGTNRYLDAAPYGGTIHYRVSAVDASGNTLFSATDVVKLRLRG